MQFCLLMFDKFFVSSQWLKVDVNSPLKRASIFVCTTASELFTKFGRRTRLGRSRNFNPIVHHESREKIRVYIRSQMRHPADHGLPTDFQVRHLSVIGRSWAIVFDILRRQANPIAVLVIELIWEILQLRRKIVVQLKVGVSVIDIGTTKVFWLQHRFAETFGHRHFNSRIQRILSRIFIWHFWSLFLMIIFVNSNFIIY